MSDELRHAAARHVRAVLLREFQGGPRDGVKRREFSRGEIATLLSGAFLAGAEETVADLRAAAAEWRRTE